ncbi:MAG: hypothetical protein K6B68_06505 [Eubacterium sp.]|nr:hypothetical protein [Eubacterium sp.]
MGENNKRRSKKRRRTDQKVVRLTRTARLNSVFIIFFIILIYVVASIIKSVSKDPITTYKVSSSNINNNIKCTAIALRNELQINSSKSGYLIYFVRDGDKVQKGSPVCTVDETGNVISAIKAAGDNDEGNELFTNADYTNIRNAIDSYKSSYSDVNFSNLYNFKSEIESKVMELSSEVMIKEINKGGAAVSSTLENIKSTESGVITYYTDGYEKKTPETLSVDDFDQTSYKKESLKTGDIMDSGSVVFKIVADENWHVVCMLSPEQAEKLKKEQNLRFVINGSPNDITASYTLNQSGDVYFANIPLNKYMVDYIDDRFLNVEIILDKYEGLKVPNSSILEKETYKIPVGYVKEDKESSTHSVTVQRFDEKSTAGDASDKSVMKDINLKIYRSDEDYYYVEKNSFFDTDILFSPDQRENTPVLSLEREKMQGVYVANAGIADFTEVEVVMSQDEFTILKDDGYLKEFDNVVLDCSQVNENQTLY